MTNPGGQRGQIDGHFMGLLVVLAAITLARAHSYLLFHSLAELFMVVVAVTTFALAWNLRRHLDNPFLLIAGIAYGPVALLDMLHLLAFKGMGVFEADANLATQLWVAQRGLDAAAVLAATLCGGRRVSARIVLAVLVAAGVALGGLIFTGLFPLCYVEGQGLTTFKIAAEYAMMASFAVAFWRLWSYRQLLPRRLARLLLLAVLLSLLEEAAFTLYVDVAGIFNMVGHLLGAVVAALIYSGVVRYGLSNPQDVLFGQLNALNVRLTDAALRDNERAALAMEMLDGGAWEWDMATPARQLSPRHGVWLGLAPEQPAMLDDWRRRVLPTDMAAYDSLVAPRAPGPALTVEYRWRRDDGTIAWFSGASRCFVDGAGTRMVGVDRDVSNQRQEEQERRRLAEDMRSFSEILAHHLQEPARLQACYAQVLRRALPSPCPPEADGAMRVIEDGANYLRRLLRDAYLYIVLDRLPQPDHPVDAARVVQAVWTRMEDQVKACAAEIQVAGPLPPVWLAEARLQDLFSILLGNAVEYRDPNRPLRVTVSCHAEPGEMVVSVADNGIGIHARHHEQIFRPFERLHTQAQHPGTGIGLALARRIVENAGGRIWLESTPDVGTTFHFALPHHGGMS